MLYEFSIKCNKNKIVNHAETIYFFKSYMAGTFLIWSSLLAFRLWYPKYNSFSDWNNATDYNYIQKSSCFVLFLLLFGFSHRITVLLGRKRHLEWFCSHHAIFSFTELKKRFLLSFQKITIYYCINRLGGFMVHYSVYSQRANKMRVWLDYLFSNSLK